MNSKLLTVFLALAVVSVMQVTASPVESNYMEFTDKGKTCTTEIGTTENTMKRIIFKRLIFDEDDMKLYEKFVYCILKDQITDTNEIKDDDTLKGMITEVFKRMLHGRTNLAKLLSKICIEDCKTVKKDTKEKTALHFQLCLMRKFFELTEDY